MMFGPTNGRKLHYVITHVIRENQITELFVLCLLCAHAKFDVTGFPTFIGALDVISGNLLIH